MNVNLKISVTKWTDQAKECYDRNCICKGCPINGLIKSSRCMMKESVLALVREFGVPKN